MQDIYVKSLMTTEVVCTSPKESLITAIHIMSEYRFSCLVVTEDDVPVGIITERDIVRLLAEADDQQKFQSLKVADVMSHPVVSVTSETTLFEALVIATAHKLRHLPVLTVGEKLAGLITQTDLVKAHYHAFEKQREIIEHSITIRTKQLHEANERLKALSLVDALLGIGNRRAMEVDLEHTHAHALRFRRSYALALFDIDFFKNYNDHYGHLAGDTALRRVATHLLESIRNSDRLYRFGGEEILLLLPETSIEGAEMLVRRTMNGLVGLGIPHEESPHHCLTMSCGLACQSEDSVLCKNWQEVVAMADRGLYIAKNSGRNQVAAMQPHGIQDMIRQHFCDYEPELVCYSC